LLLGVCGLVAIVWFLTTKLGIIAAPQATPVVLVIAALVGTVAAVVAFTGLTRRVGMPIKGVMEGAEQVAKGDYSVRVVERGPPPIRALAHSFNTMTERLGKDDRLRRDLMADIAHELRTPLAVIQGKLEGLLDRVYERDDAQLSELVAEVHVLGRLVEDLRTFALSESGALKLEKEPTDIRALAADVAHSLEREARTRNIDLRLDESADLPTLTVDAVRIREVLANLLTNALEHTPAGGAIVVRLVDIGKEGVRVEVSDTGSGIPPDEVNRAFDRFHKGPESRGSGLGLSIARNLVLAHGGQIELSSEPGRGTQIRFTLPRDTPD
jgi:signal transduction histidine kinase